MKYLIIIITTLSSIHINAKTLKITTQPAYIDINTFNISIDYPFKKNYSIAAAFYREIIGPTVLRHTGNIIRFSPMWYPTSNDKKHMLFASLDFYLAFYKETILHITENHTKIYPGFKFVYEYIFLDYGVIRLGLVFTKAFSFIKSTNHLLFWELGIYL